jgi:DNA replication and repair protein RecF
LRLLDLEVRSFRNLRDAHLRLDPATTLLVGANGQGKTSLLEAIGVLATTKSFRHAKAVDMARRGTSAFAVRGTVIGPAGTVELSVELADGRRHARIAGAEVEVGELIERLTVVPVTAAHAGIVRGGPHERRDFLDRGVLGLRPAYIRTLAQYRQAVKHKAALLRQPRPFDPLLLETWNDRLARAGAEVILRRREYLVLLRETLREVGRALLPEDEQLALELRDSGARGQATAVPADAPAAAVEARLREQIQAHSAREADAAQVLVGPHRDDLLILHQGSDRGDVRRFASSGQQRNALLALELAQVEVFCLRRGEPPVLLVDDVDTEIDPARLRTFIEHAGGRAQTVLTSSKAGLLEGLVPGASIVRVEGGVLSPA